MAHEPMSLNSGSGAWSKLLQAGHLCQEYILFSELLRVILENLSLGILLLLNLSKNDQIRHVPSLHHIVLSVLS